MPRRTLKRKKAGSPARQESPTSGGQRFRVLFIGMSGPLPDPTVRVLLVGTTGVRAVYEGMKPWSKCKHWIGGLRGLTVPEDSVAQVCKTFERTQLRSFKERRLLSRTFSLSDFTAQIARRCYVTGTSC
jgi:hypothetical protein